MTHITPIRLSRFNKGVSLFETIVFIVVISLALTALVRVYSQAVSASVDPVARTKGLELAQAQLDEILSRKFDENTPSGGIPACDSADGVACAGIVPEGDFDDVGDFNGLVDNSVAGYSVSVSVVDAGGDLGLAASQARRISVVAALPGGDSLTLSVYKTNF